MAIIRDVPLPLLKRLSSELLQDTAKFRPGLYLDFSLKNSFCVKQGCSSEQPCRRYGLKISELLLLASRFLPIIIHLIEVQITIRIAS
jgi:hypothetical protein